MNDDRRPATEPVRSNLGSRTTAQTQLINDLIIVLIT